MERQEHYEAYLRRRITELLLEKDISEHYLSLALGKSGSYIRAITSGKALPSVKELFNIIAYFNLTPAQFFSGIEEDYSLRSRVMGEIARLDNEELEKVEQFLGWIKE